MTTPSAPASLRSWQRAQWAVLAGGAGVAVAFPRVATGPSQWAPLGISLLVLGVPHGAVDHHVADRLAPAAPRWARRRRRRVVAVYAAGALAGLGLWVVAPVGALGAFLVVSAAHWGQGEGWWARAVSGRAPFATPGGALAWAAARGALPIFGAALSHPDEAHAVMREVVGRFAPGAAVPLASAGVRAAGLTALGALVLLAAAVSVRDGRRAAAPVPGALARDLCELAGLALFFAAVPAAWAVGLYFLAWHAPRHVARLVSARPAQRELLTRGRHVAAIRAFHHEALPCSAAALAGMAALAARRRYSADAVPAIALAAIAALTYPHVAVVAWMDARQGVWR